MKQTGKRVAVGVLTALLIYIALLALIALMIVRGTVGEGGAWTCACVFAALSAFAGVKTATWGAPEPLGVSALCAAAFWGLILLLGFLANDGLDASRAALLALPVLVGAGLACLTNGGGKRRGKRKRRSRK